MKYKLFEKTDFEKDQERFQWQFFGIIFGFFLLIYILNEVTFGEIIRFLILGK